MNSNLLFRRLILNLSKNEGVTRLVRKWGPKMGAYRFVAGDTLADAAGAVKRQNALGIKATLDRLGEGTVDRTYAEAARDAYTEMLDEIAKEGLDANVSLKLTQLGLDLDPAFCEENLRRILDRADSHGNFVRIDMEDSPRTEATLALFEKVFKDHTHVGLVIQAYLRRSEEDVARLGQLGANLRIVKGAYMEPPEVAFPDKRDVDENYKRLVALHLTGGHYTAVATHDPELIRFTKELVAGKGIPHDRYEFQMLYGIRSKVQEELAKEGYRVRVYVPFGPDWYPYFTRRLAERPANLGFFLRHLLRS